MNMYQVHDYLRRVHSHSLWSVLVINLLLEALRLQLQVHERLTDLWHQGWERGILKPTFIRGLGRRVFTLSWLLRSGGRRSWDTPRGFPHTEAQSIFRGQGQGRDLLEQADMHRRLLIENHLALRTWVTTQRTTINTSHQ